MPKNAIKYKDGYLMPGSHAHKLHTEGKMKELEKHMDAIIKAARKLEGRSE